MPDTDQTPVRTPQMQKSWMPTRKWWVATITALGAIATLWIQAGSLTMSVQIALVGAVVQAALTYVLPNVDTPGGVPVRPVT